MANTISLVTSVNDAHTSLIVTDTTTYTNPTRANVGVFVKVFKVNFSGLEVALATTSDDEDPGTDSVFTCSLDQDGHYRYKYIAVPDYNAGTTYALGEVAYDTVAFGVYKSKQAGNVGNALSDTAFWEAISDPTSLIASSPANADTATVNKVVSTLTEDKRNTLAITAAVEQSTDAYRLKDVRSFELVDLLLAGLQAADSAGEFNIGEKIARRAEAINAD